MESPWDGGTKVCLKGPMALELGMQHRVLEYYQVCSNFDPWTLTYFMERSNLVPYALYGQKVKQWIFRNYCRL